ncbi:hypothetical protein Taro_008637 [Colocasia esculenta]|uniref:protein-serine/threonine phosphatase n=1 Tax=Colocasia esculenta TaxID=4460 RepID=A0A843TU68_COLES|nr:hypothetical protein [Colocasia esculenta]
MGCVHGRCCCRYDDCSDDDAEDKEVSTPCALNGHGSHGHFLTQSSLGSAAVPSHNFRLQYAFLTQRGHYPDSPDRENQDSFCIKTQLQGNPNLHFFGVFDGHGLFGTQCSNFVKERLVDILSADLHLAEDPVKAYNLAFRITNSELHESQIDDSMSGTTAITVLVNGDTLYVANVGDSRAVAGVWNGNSVVAEDLSSDQTPFRRDEYERVKLCGARVLSVDQVEGIKDPNIQTWGDEESDEGDPPRLWVQNGMYPGTAFTRSVGDLTAEKIGVTADPEVLTAKITPDHLFFVVASDGVFEFLSSQTVVNMNRLRMKSIVQVDIWIEPQHFDDWHLLYNVLIPTSSCFGFHLSKVSKYADPRDACSAIAAESYRIWLEHETRTDDITIIIVHIKDMCNV